MDSIAMSVLNKVVSKASETRTEHGNVVKENLTLNIEGSAIVNTQARGSLNSLDPFAVYTFESGKPGYVVIATDDRLPAVIAFSDKEVFSANNPPSAMLHMMEQYANRLSEGNSISGNNKEYQTFSEAPSEVEPLLGDIAFSQFSPYNDKCPLMDGKRTVTGCLATAMAQLMAYYKYPQKMSGDKIEYTTARYGLPVSWDCSTTVFDWDNMLDTYIYYVDRNINTTTEQYMACSELKLSPTNSQCLEISMLISVSTDALNGEIQLLLADDEGNFICPVGNKGEIENLLPRYGWGTSEIKHFVPNDISDGLYRLYLGFRLKESDEWSIVQREKNATNVDDSLHEKCYVSIFKSGMHYTIENEMFNCTNGGYNRVQGDAVATLCAACGAATQMNYGTDGSSTNNSNMAFGLANYMGYNENMYIVTSTQFATEGWVEKIIQSELTEKRPVYCCGILENGGSHAFVIDGYMLLDSTPYFHVNWGWNGDDNGYFLLDNMTTSGGNNYGHGYSLTLGIEPNNKQEQGFVFCAKNVSTFCTDNKLSVIVETLSNCTIKPFGGDVIIYAIDKAGNEHTLKNYTWDSWKASAGIGLWEPPTINIPSSMESGEYQIVIRVKEKGSSIERDVLTPSFPYVYIDNTTSAINGTKVNDTSRSSAIYDLSGKKIKAGAKKQITIIDKKKVF